MAELMEAPGDMIITPANVQAMVQEAVQAELSRIRVTPQPVPQVQEAVQAELVQIMLTKQDIELCLSALVTHYQSGYDKGHEAPGLIQKLSRIKSLI
jgi:hypothetical protein